MSDSTTWYIPDLHIWDEVHYSDYNELSPIQTFRIAAPNLLIIQDKIGQEQILQPKHYP